MSAPIPAPDTPQGPSLSPDQTVTQESAAASAAVHTQARELATTLAATPQISAMCVKGVVTSVVNPGVPPTISVQIGGDTTTTIDNVRFIDSYSPVVGDTCLLIKQESGVFALGQMNDFSTVAECGWTAPTLGSGFVTNTNDPVLWRMVVEHGTNMIQLRGRVEITGSPTALWTMPVGCRPLFNIAPLLAARDPISNNTGSNAIQIAVMASGAITLVGGNVGIAAAGTADLRTGVDPGTANTNSVTPGNTGNTDVNHTHFSSNDGNYVSGTQTTQINTGFTNHNHTSAAHNHIGGQHQHALFNVTYPDYVSFNGVSYFL